MYFNFIFLIGMFVCLLPTLSLGSTLPHSKPSTFLKNGFDLQKYKACAILMKQCPSGAVLPDETCIKKIVTNNPDCSQLEKSSTLLNAVPATLVVEDLKSNFILI